MKKYNIEKLKKFFNDPDWVEVEKIILDYIEPLRDVLNVKTDLTSEEVKAEIRARQITYIQLKTFLEDVGILKENKEEKELNFE